MERTSEEHPADYRLREERDPGRGNRPGSHKPMHILMTTDTVGGVWQYTQELVSGLCARGCRVTLVSFGDLLPDEELRWLRGLQVDFRPTPLRLEWMDDAEEDVATATEMLSRIIAETAPDLLHTNQYAFAAAGFPLPTLLVAHSDVVSWWRAVYGERPPQSHFHAWYADLVRRSLQHASVVVAPTHDVLRDLRLSFDWSYALDAPPAETGTRRPARVISNGRTPALFNPYISKENYALALGRLWDSAKQITLLCRSGLPLTVKLAGSTRHPTLGERPLPGLENLEFLGQQPAPRLVQLLSRARIYVATSRYEPFGLAPLEAALSRCALLSNDIASLREVWGDAALYFKVNDGDDLVARLRELAGDDELCQRIANQCYRRARDLYSANRMSDRYLELYAELLQSREERQPPAPLPEEVAS